MKMPALDFEVVLTSLVSDSFDFISFDNYPLDITPFSLVSHNARSAVAARIVPMQTGGVGDDSITSGTGNDTHSGGDGNDTIKSGDGNDSIWGDAGNDSLVGQGGADSMTGGTGNDIFVVDNSGDKVVELSGEGTDTVKTSLTNYTLTSNVEKLTETGTSASSLTGNTLNNTITGNSGNDTLNGGAGNDTLIGGIGNDTYRLDAYSDVVTESSGAGTDTVIFLNDFTFTNYPVTYVAPDNVENVTGGSSVSQFNLIGNSLNNVLTGNNQNDYLTGGAGIDTLRGGQGNDVYTVEDSGDLVIENANDGWDTVTTTLTTYTLPTNVEEMFGFSSSNAVYTGNSGDNRIVANGPSSGNNSGGANDRLDGAAGNDTLFAGFGNDTLIGGAGNDQFEFGSTPGSSNIDTITDFNAANDVIWLNHNTFAYGVGALLTADFKVIGTGGTVDASDRIIYDQTNGKLYYDSDGSGANAKVQIAVLSGAPVLTAADFIFG